MASFGRNLGPGGGSFQPSDDFGSGDFDRPQNPGSGIQGPLLGSGRPMGGNDEGWGEHFEGQGGEFEGE